MYSPNAYRVLLIETPTGQLVKLFASWSGGYCQGDEYRLNSGTELITEDEDSYFFYGYSGSCYKLRKSSKGSLTSYSAGIYNRILRHEGVKEIMVQQAIDILKGEEQFEYS
jgi:hypothetical protein